MRPAVVYHPNYAPTLPPGHRFPMPKYELLRRHLLAHGLTQLEMIVEPLPAPRAWLELAHDPAYVSAVLEQRLDRAAERQVGLPVTAEIARRACAAVGGTVLTARLALEHGLACNLAGGSHHAHQGYGSGFCVFNDVAVASRLMRAEGLARRILIVDLDVHQGDGTAAILAGEAEIFTLSVHCRTNFPARKRRSHLDVALDPGTGDAAYLALIGDLVPSLLARLAPDLVFYNAGVDPHERDRLGRLALTDGGILARDRLVLESCRTTGVPLACVVGGGYGDDIEEVVRRHALLHRAAQALGDTS